jgi:hypothetical protein
MRECVRPGEREFSFTRGNRQQVRTSCRFRSADWFRFDLVISNGPTERVKSPIPSSSRPRSLRKKSKSNYPSIFPLLRPQSNSLHKSRKSPPP